MAEAKIKPAKRVAGKSKFRLPERSPRVAEENPLREILQEAKAQEEALAAKPVPQTLPTPAKRIAGVGHTQPKISRKSATSDTPAKRSAGVSNYRQASRAALSPANTHAFGEFSKRWAPILRSGQMSVCRVLFEMTHAVGLAECFTSMPKLAIAAGLKERQCYNVVSQLEMLGFIERPEIFNTPTKKGTVFRLFMEPQSLDAEWERRYHIGREDNQD